MPVNDYAQQSETIPQHREQVLGVASLFTDKLLFTSGNIASLAGINGWDLRIAAGEPGGNAAVPPISVAYARLLTDFRLKADSSDPPRRPDLELVDMCILQDDFANGGEVTVQIKLRSGMQEETHSKTYRGKDLVYVNNFPYLSLWPCVYLAPDEWKDYYVAMVPVWDPVPKPAGSECEEIDANHAGHFDCFTFAASEKDVCNIKPQDKSGEPFEVLHTEKFPCFIPLKYMDPLGNWHEGGCLIARPAGGMVKADVMGVAVAAIDFGASNTACAVRCGAATTGKVLDGDLVEPLVRVKMSSISARAVEVFHRYYGPSTAGRDGKFPSVAQMYDISGKDPLMGGQILLTENGIISYFAAQNSNLQAAGIYNELEHYPTSFKENGNRAVQMFVTQLTMLCALAAKRSGYRNIEYCFSYPDMCRRSDLQKIWVAAIDHIRSRRIFASVEAHCVPEGDAAAQYVLHNETLLARPVPEAGFAVVDIGGGTTTMTVWQSPPDRPLSPPQKLGSVSFRYAGSQIFSHSFFTWFKNNPQDLKTLLPNIFGWNDLTDTVVSPFASAAEKARTLKDAKAKKAIRSYIDVISGVSSLNDPAYPTLTALLNGLLEEPGIDPLRWNAPECDGLRTMVNFKLKGILFLLANLIWECDGIHPEFGTYTIFLVGGGTQAFYLLRGAPELVFREKANEMLAALTNTDPDAVAETFRFVQPGMTDPKAAVANGALICMEQPWRRILFRPMDDPRPDAPPEAEEDRPNEEYRFEKLKVLYRAFVMFVIERDPSLQSLLPKLELPSLYDQPTPNQLSVKSKFTSGARNVWHMVSRNLDKDVSERMRLSIFAVRMAEELLDI